MYGDGGGDTIFLPFGSTGSGITRKYGGGVTTFFVKESGSELLRLTIAIKEVAMTMKVTEATLSFAIGNSLSF